jgi:hypothetical protein
VNDSQRRHGHYFRKVPTTTIDVYRVCKAFEVTDPAVEHAIKKCLLAGGRGTKSFRQDIIEAMDSLSRCLEMLTEEEAVSGG